ncbi:NADPH-dependent 7-cyano-7-deazaguanine reductase QueF [Catenovulum sediminis]|uniref:NADPH-dependent 7-cyano-7-deazaguanine reductase n=1 Tax=Catenovulum sediminis TaxID=1740262 RepID=A0ABV1REI0_9ALTE|nr:NADPH-dependent 7-cyano-7-deazaguanine reductase QueF [Catenovulum sediminis]
MSQQNSSDLLKELKLGKHTDYVDQYDPKQLQGVSRQLMRDTLPTSTKAFYGLDIWTGYEISWLSPSGKPVVYIAEFFFSVDSPNLVESKSFKLYLNSFNQSHFKNAEQVTAIMETDLSAVSGKPVSVKLYTLDEFAKRQVTQFQGILLDDLPVNIESYDYQPELVCATSTEEKVEETLVSHLLKSNCLVTGQPDWASIVIRYTGQKIDHNKLLQYIVSFRNHNEFHEHCVERIFRDIESRLNPDKLSVYARYTRRGGLDINPIRLSNTQLLDDISNHRLVRQ